MARARVDKQSKIAEVNIQRKSLEDLNEHPRNDEVREHPDPGTEEWEALKASLSHDYFDPLIWNSRNGQLVSGHLRKKVMTEMGFTEADVVVVDYDEETHLARLLAANKLQGISLRKGISGLLGELRDSGFELPLTGFSLSEVGTFFDTEPDFEFPSDDNDTEEQSETEEAPDSAICYVQLIFSKKQNSRFSALINKIRDDHGQEIEDQYDDKSFGSVCLWLLERFAASDK